MKLFNVLNKLNKREITKFKHFLASPLFNQRTDIKQVFKIYIEENARRYPPPIFWAKAFPEQVFSIKKWNLLTSRLFKLLESFLVIIEMQKSEVQKKIYLAKVYRKLQIEKLFKEAVRDSHRALEKQNFRNTDYLQNIHDLSFEEYDYIISINRKEKTNLQEVSDHLDTYFLAAKLRQACNALSREIINQEQYKIKLLDKVLTDIEEDPFYLKTPAIAIYYHYYRAISSKDNENYFLQFREAITNYQHLFPPSEMRDIYTFAINYCIRKLNTGSALFVREAFELYLLSLEQGFLLEDGIMLESTYSNIVFLAAKLKKFKWAENFIQGFQQHLKPAYREPLSYFSLGKLFYEQGDYKNSLQQLIQVESKASFLYLGTRILQLKIYYEIKEFDLLENLLESLRVYLQRSKDLGYRKKNYNNIFLFTKQLLQLPAMNKKEKDAFRQEIISLDIFTEKDWFLEQIG